MQTIERALECKKHPCRHVGFVRGPSYHASYQYCHSYIYIIAPAPAPPPAAAAATAATATIAAATTTATPIVLIHKPATDTGSE